MNVFYTNSNDLKNKVSELQIVAESRDCKVLGITETMFSSDIYDAEVSIERLEKEAVHVFTCTTPLLRMKLQ